MSFPDCSNHARASTPHSLGKLSFQRHKQPSGSGSDQLKLSPESLCLGQPSVTAGRVWQLSPPGLDIHVPGGAKPHTGSNTATGTASATERLPGPSRAPWQAMPRANRACGVTCDPQRGPGSSNVLKHGHSSELTRSGLLELHQPYSTHSPGSVHHIQCASSKEKMCHLWYI